MQKYHDEPKQYKGYLKSALMGGQGSEGVLALGRNGRGRPRLFSARRVQLSAYRR